jgi:hypothetical protein
MGRYTKCKGFVVEVHRVAMLLLARMKKATRDGKASEPEVSSFKRLLNDSRFYVEFTDAEQEYYRLFYDMAQCWSIDGISVVEDVVNAAEKGLKAGYTVCEQYISDFGFLNWQSYHSVSMLLDVRNVSRENKSLTW